MYPESGLPDRVNVVRYVQSGTDADDNPSYTPTTVISGRKGRFYRDAGKATRFVREGFQLKGVVTFKYHPGDKVLHTDEITMSGPEFQDIGETFQVGYASLKMAWKKPSHWEIAIGVYV